MGALIDNIAILSFGSNNGSSNRSNRFEYTEVNIENDRDWEGRQRGGHRRNNGSKHGHKGFGKDD
jgi:hypothetical protein